MSEEKILKKGSEYANKSWNVLGYPKEHDNAREDFIAGALWAVKNCSIPDVSVSFLYDFVNEFTDTEIPKEAIKETLDKLNER